jgi:hypothetical protein
VSKALQKMVDELNLTKTDVYDHCLMLKKEMDDTNWAEEAEDFRKRLLCKASLVTWLNKRKDGQRKRQDKAIIKRKEVREKKKALAVAERQQINSILANIM